MAGHESRERSESKGPSTGFPRPTMASSSSVPAVYILRCADGALYIGHTQNLAARVAKHQEGSASAFTAKRRPVALVFSEMHPNLIDATRRERQLKRWTRAKKEALIAGGLNRRQRL